MRAAERVQKKREVEAPAGAEHRREPGTVASDAVEEGSNDSGLRPLGSQPMSLPESGLVLDVVSTGWETLDLCPLTWVSHVLPPLGLPWFYKLPVCFLSAKKNVLSVH